MSTSDKFGQVRVKLRSDSWSIADPEHFVAIMLHACGMDRQLMSDNKCILICISELIAR